MTMSPLIWSIAGTDSGGGAGLSADQRAAEAFGLHLCPVPAAITAQNSVTVAQVQAVSPDLLRAQLATLHADLPPRAVKTGLVGSAENARELARAIDRLRRERPVPLVVDPVLRASTGAALANGALLGAYRHEVLPRASVVTPNRREAVALLGAAPDTPTPELAQGLLGLGAQAVVITGGDEGGPLSADWLHTPHAQGWLSLPRVPTPHHHGTGCTFASALAAALALGWVAADAAVLAKMLTTHALRRATALGGGAGPVRAGTGFGADASLMPQLSLGDALPTAWRASPAAPAPGLYAIVDSAARVQACARAGADTVQLRFKHHDPARIAAEVRAALANTDGARVVINDHWRLALDLGARELHLGQEDLLALSPADHARLAQARAQGVRLGLSSHSLWELCRARGLAPDLIACGPVWPTTTKDMPWRPQGLDNLAWWARMAGAPVVGIGGVLAPEQLRAVAASGAAGGCVVRGLGDDPALTLPVWREAWQAGQQDAPLPCPELPHPTL
jgi:hydroxymethylpyrimidine kinase/phosphomethylpyrimidine kinase/thiamine-phosphate diphosphorylase